MLQENDEEGSTDLLRRPAIRVEQDGVDVQHEVEELAILLHSQSHSATESMAKPEIRPRSALNAAFILVGTMDIFLRSKYTVLDDARAS